VNEAPPLAQRIEVVEQGYEYLLAYAAQGRQDDAGTELRDTLSRMHESMGALRNTVEAAFKGYSQPTGAHDFVATVERDLLAARGAIGLVLGRARISSLLIDNLNASVHVRALLTDLFLIEQALKSPAKD
jgi:hypothetical protein